MAVPTNQTFFKSTTQLQLCQFYRQTKIYCSSSWEWSVSHSLNTNGSHKTFFLNFDMQYMRSFVDNWIMFLLCIQTKEILNFHVGLFYYSYKIILYRTVIQTESIVFKTWLMAVISEYLNWPNGSFQMYLCIYFKKHHLCLFSKLIVASIISFHHLFSDR